MLRDHLPAVLDLTKHATIRLTPGSTNLTLQDAFIATIPGGEETVAGGAAILLLLFAYVLVKESHRLRRTSMLGLCVAEFNDRDLEQPGGTTTEAQTTTWAQRWCVLS